MHVCCQLKWPKSNSVFPRTKTTFYNTKQPLIYIGEDKVFLPKWSSVDYLNYKSTHIKIIFFNNLNNFVPLTIGQTWKSKTILHSPFLVTFLNHLTTDNPCLQRQILFFLPSSAVMILQVFLVDITLASLPAT